LIYHFQSRVSILIQLVLLKISSFRAVVNVFSPFCRHYNIYNSVSYVVGGHVVICCGWFCVFSVCFWDWFWKTGISWMSDFGTTESCCRRLFVCFA
jgi:hypothetical protein